MRDALRREGDDLLILARTDARFRLESISCLTKRRKADTTLQWTAAGGTPQYMASPLTSLPPSFCICDRKSKKRVSSFRPPT